MSANINLHPSWLSRLSGEFEKNYMKKLKRFLLQEKKAGKEIYPPGDKIFSALNNTPFDEVKVVILGQDPYHGPQQANGLSFSVQPGIRIPPSLVNIYTELSTDLGIPPASHGCLTSWARQGVLLLNSVLTVEKNRAASHKGCGWEEFTDTIIRIVDAEKKSVVFILWGSYAQAKGVFINRSRHLVISSPHPSPFSAARGFFGNRPFSRANQWLEEKGLSAVDWALPRVAALEQAGDAPI